MEKKFNFVYLTTNLVNKKQYIGDHSTNDLNCYKTLNYLGSGKLTLHPAIKKYGRENFKREILEYFDTKQKAFDAQEKYIKLYKTHVSKKGYNISWKGGTGPLTEEMRKKIIKKKKGLKLSKETKIKIKNALTGIKQSEKTKKKRADKIRGMKRSEKTKQKMKIAAKNRKKTSEETRQKMRIAAKNISEETRQKMSKSHIGKKHSEETKRKISLIHKGKSQKIIICPYCKRKGGYRIMKRWHFNNCKLNEKI